MAKILLADDDRVARSGFKAMLEAEGHQVITAKNGEEAVSVFLSEQPKLVLLDVMMPKKNGIAACNEIRALDSNVPIIFFTAMPSEASLVRGLGMGADDYIDKHRSSDEFLARIGAALRRKEAFDSAFADKSRIRLGETIVDFRKMCVIHGNEREELTRSEGQLLQLLVSGEGRPFSFTEIFDALHGEGYVGDDSAIRTMMRRLKSKLGRAGSLIANERGVGYRFVK